MSLAMTIEVPVTFPPIGQRGPKGLPPAGEQPALPPGRVPRVARLMALALRFEHWDRRAQ